MNQNRIRMCLIGITILSSHLAAQTPGYFKDIFSDGGAHLTSMANMFAAVELGLSVEYLYTDDASVQNGVMIADETDSNGHLLYPDGAPRFRMIFTNGGQSTSHGTSLGETGRERVRTFYANGGSFSGSCAGAFIASLHYLEAGENYAYYHIWPGRTHTTGLLDAYTGHIIPSRSRLLDYFDFGGDMYIDNVRHNGGCYANEQIDYPPETEILLRYDYPGWDMDGKVSAWAYKPFGTEGVYTGRVVVTGSHPEFVESGERFELMQAMLLYALDGVGRPRVKADLINGELRAMDLSTEDGLPEFTRIGDKQYHHFTLSVPPEASYLTIELTGEAGFDFNLYANPADFAFEGAAQFSSTSQGAEHVLQIPVEDSGLWYIGVECASTVESFNYIYYGGTDVLDGVAYDITATWDTSSTTSVIQPPAMVAEDFELLLNYPNPFNPTTTIQYSLRQAGSVKLTVLDIRGQELITLQETVQLPGSYEVIWNGRDQHGTPVSTGMYFCRLDAGSYSQTIKMVYLR